MSDWVYEPGEEMNAKNPKHYQVGRCQPIEIMQDYLSPEEFIGFLRGNIIKYTLRAGRKTHDPSPDIAKVNQYSEWLTQVLKGEKINPQERK